MFETSTDQELRLDLHLSLLLLQSRRSRNHRISCHEGSKGHRNIRISDEDFKIVVQIRFLTLVFR